MANWDSEAIADRFRQAAMGMIDWTEALAALADATAARAGQIAVIDPGRTMTLNVVSNSSDDEIADYYAAGGADPARNPRTRVLLAAPIQHCLTEADFATPTMIDREPIYRGLFNRHDIPHSCLMRLPHLHGSMAALALLRPGSAGAATARDRHLIETLAPAIAGAIRTGIDLGTTLDRAVIDTAERIAGPAILLGRSMTVRSLSPAADALLRAGTHLSVHNGRLCATSRAAADALDRAFAAVTNAAAAGRDNAPLVLRTVQGDDPLPAELAPLPVRMAGPLSMARAILTIRLPPCPARIGPSLVATFGLTAAEVDIAMGLLAGADLRAIAERRGAVVSTVRGQLKSLFAKTGTSRQTELVLKLRPLR